MLKDRMKVLKGIKELRVKPMVIEDCIVELTIVSARNLNFRRLLKPGDIPVHRPNELKTLAADTEYFIRASINVDQMIELETETSTEFLERTIVIFNGLDPNYYTGNQQMKFAAAVWTRSEDISPILLELSRMYQNVKLGEKIETFKYLRLKRKLQKKDKKIKEKEKKIEDLEKRVKELELQEKESRERTQELERKLKEEVEKNQEAEDKRKFENEATIKF